MTHNFSAELSLSKVFGDFSDAKIASINLLAQPFPEWRISPYFSIGAGVIQTDPNVTLVAENRCTHVHDAAVYFSCRVPPAYRISR